MLFRGKRSVALLFLLLSVLLLSACRAEKTKQGVDIEIDSTAADSVRAVPKGALFVSKEGDFSARLPFGFVDPARESARIEGDSASRELTVYTAEAGEHAVMIGFSTISGDDRSDTKKRLDAARDAALGSIGGTLLSEKEIDHHGHPGRSITLTAPIPSGITALGRLDFYLIDGRLYALVYLSPTREDFSSPDVEEFFGSFRLSGEEEY